MCAAAITNEFAVDPSYLANIEVKIVDAKKASAKYTFRHIRSLNDVRFYFNSYFYALKEPITSS
jgi:hypothetical protein